MRASCIPLLLAVSGCNFLTTDLEDGAPVREVTAPASAERFGQAIVALLPDTCGTPGNLIVAGQLENGVPQLYLVTFGASGGSSRSIINDRHQALPAGQTIEVMARGSTEDSVFIQTNERTVEVTVDSSCDGSADEACEDICWDGTEIDPAPELIGNEADVDLFGDADRLVHVTGNATTGTITAAGRGPIEVPEGADIDGLGLAVAGMRFGDAGGPEELAVGGNKAILLFFRTGFGGDCDPRTDAPSDVDCD